MQEATNSPQDGPGTSGPSDQNDSSTASVQAAASGIA